jgi:ribosomal protein S18 acetylase RimI-like enzyme
MPSNGPYRITEAITADHRRAVHDYLSNHSYWARGRTAEAVDLSLQHSRCFAVEAQGALVGFARAITDQTTFAYLADVFILPAHRGQGLGKWLVEFIVEQSDLRSLSWLLATADAQSLYQRYGFSPVGTDNPYMKRPSQSAPP